MNRIERIHHDLLSESLKWLSQIPEFRSFWQLLLPRPEMAEQTLASLAEEYSWNAVSMLRGLMWLSEMAQNHDQIFFRYGEDPAQFLFYIPQPEGSPEGSRKTEARKANRKGTVVLLPGGAYEMVCHMVEGFPLAEFFHREGYAVACVNYRTGEALQRAAGGGLGLDAAIFDVDQAVRFLCSGGMRDDVTETERDHEILKHPGKKKESVHDSAADARYYLAGCSAGAHLAGVYVQRLCSRGRLGFADAQPGMAAARDASESQPCSQVTSLTKEAAVEPVLGGLILSYPPVLMGDFRGTTMHRLLFGEEPGLSGARKVWEEKIASYSLTNLKGSYVPPVWLWNFDHDRAIPGNHSAILANALKGSGVPVQYRCFSGTQHGWWNATGEPYGDWVRQALRWFETF